MGQQAAAPVLVVDCGRAEDLAMRLGLECVPEVPAQGTFLAFDGDVLGYHVRRDRRQHVLCVDFAADGRRLRAISRREPLIRACVARARVRPMVLDATAGLGGDSMVLAGYGCQVVAAERDPIVHALLADGLRRARAVPWLAGAAARVRLLPTGDVRDWMSMLTSVDVAYADPMFERGGRGGSRIAMQLLAELARGRDGAALVTRLRTEFPRTVVKRRRRAPVLAGPPHWRIAGRAMRFDVYAP